MHKIVVLNTKGGSGKSTLSTNLASYFAMQNRKPTLVDMDPQGSSLRWVSKRTEEQPVVYSVAGFERKTGVTRAFAMRAHSDSQVTIVDTPAGVEAHRLADITRDAQHILVPVLPSDIDIHAATRCISNLLLIAKVNRNTQRLAVIANRVKRNTVMYHTLMKFLNSLQIPVVATLRDTQAYVHAFDTGVGLFEMKDHFAKLELEQWQTLLGWLSNGAPEVDNAETTKPTVIQVPSNPLPRFQPSKSPAVSIATATIPAAASVAATASSIIASPITASSAVTSKHSTPSSAATPSAPIQQISVSSAVAAAVSANKSSEPAQLPLGATNTSSAASTNNKAASVLQIPPFLRLR